MEILSGQLTSRARDISAVQLENDRLKVFRYVNNKLGLTVVFVIEFSSFTGRQAKRSRERYHIKGVV